MLTIFNKYKERDPKDTIKIIWSFFQKQGYRINIVNECLTDGNTYWCSAELHNKNKEVVLRSNGKGTTAEYCLASCFAEMYERYCSTLPQGLFTLEKETQNSYIKNGYYISSDEELKDFNYIYNSSQRLKKFLNFIESDDYDYLKLHAKIYNKENVLPCVPFQSLTNNDIKYFNPNLISRLGGSSGLAAGNTLQEALVQGISEVFEHYVAEELYYNIQTKYYVLNFDNLNLPDYLLNIVNSIKINYELTIIDLSYNFNLPVLASLLFNREKHVWYINIGSSPVFEIALERILTEIYQGYTNFNDSNYIKTEMLPNRLLNPWVAIGIGNQATTIRQFYPEELIFNQILVNDFNQKVFLTSNNYSNLELLNHQKKIILKNNFNIYYRDISKTTDMTAIRLYLDAEKQQRWKFDIYKEFELNDIKELILNQSKLNIEYLKFLRNENYNINNMIEYCNNYINWAKKYQDDFNNYKFYSLDLCLNQLFNLLSIFRFNPQNIKDYFNNLYWAKKNLSENYSEITESYLYFFTLYRYKNSKKYTKNEIKILLSNLGFQLNNFIEDYNNCDNLLYLIENIQLKLAKDLYQKKSYEL